MAKYRPRAARVLQRMALLADMAARHHRGAHDLADLIEREPGALRMFLALAALSDDAAECLDIAQRSLGADAGQKTRGSVIGRRKSFTH